MDRLKLQYALADLVFNGALLGFVLAIACVIVSILVCGTVIYNMQHGWPLVDAVKRAWTNSRLIK